MVVEKKLSAASSTKSFTTETAIEARPIKLRDACNQCYAAKVRCQGDKTGCERCVHRKLSCEYSESRVGKVVGKRRKRLLDGAIGPIHAGEWVIANYTQPRAVASPASTSSSEDTAKHTVNSAWESAMDSAETLKPGLSSEAFEYRVYEPWNVIDTDRLAAGTAHMSSLSLSPQTTYLSPGLQTGCTSSYRNHSEPGPITADYAASQILPPPLSTQAFCAREPQADLEEEMVCIKLLAYLKKCGTQEDQSLETLLSLIQKSDAVLRRILTSQRARSDYGCVMLLSSIIVKVINLCEKVCQEYFQICQSETSEFITTFGEEFLFAFGERPSLETERNYRNADERDQPSSSYRRTIQDLLGLIKQGSAEVSRLLKEPDEIQSTGKHEGLHVEMERRLDAMLNILR